MANTERQRAAHMRKAVRERRARQKENSGKIWRERGWLRARDLPWSRSTVWRFEQRGILTSTHVGGVNFYRVEQVEALLRNGVPLKQASQSDGPSGPSGRRRGGPRSASAASANA